MSANRERLIRCAAKFMGGNRDSAEDAVQEAYLRVHTSIHVYDSSYAMSTWFGVILKRVCSRSYKSLLPCIEDEEASASSVLFTSSSDDICNEAAERGLHAAWDWAEMHTDALVIAALLAVPTLDRALLTRVYVLQEDQYEIAEDWGISYTALRVRMTAARRKLATAYALLAESNRGN